MSDQAGAGAVGFMQLVLRIRFGDLRQIKEARGGVWLPIMRA